MVAWFRAASLLWRLQPEAFPVFVPSKTIFKAAIIILGIIDKLLLWIGAIILLQSRLKISPFYPVQQPEKSNTNETKLWLEPVILEPLKLFLDFQLFVPFVFSPCCQWERLQTVLLYAYESLRARVSAVSICLAYCIPLCACVCTNAGRM